MLIAALLLAQTVPATPSACAATDAALPAALAGWTGERGGFEAGKPILLRTLSSMVGGVAAPYASTDAQPGHVEWDFSIDKAGKYGIAIDNAAWVDVVRGGESEPLKSAGYSHGPTCSTIHKIVNFDLVPGKYRLRLSRLTVGSTKAMLVVGE